MKAFLSIPLRILTHNIRYATTTPEPGEEVWSVRAPRLISELKYHTRHVPTSVICLQEVLHGQLQDIMAGLNVNRVSALLPDVVPAVMAPPPGIYKQQELKEDAGRSQDLRSAPEQDDLLQNNAPETARIQPLRTTDAGKGSVLWDYVGIGRDDGFTAGEYSPILFQPRIWDLVEWSTLWLSETPLIPSKGWDAASPRILTTAVFSHRLEQQRLIVMNTHLDDQGTVARNASAHLILDTIAYYQKKYHPIPIVLTGDLNSETNEEAYQIIAGSRSRMYDVRDMVAKEDRYGENNTFTGFGQDKPQRIDFVFITDSHQWQVTGYSAASNRFDDGVYISDHRAVIADLAIMS